MLRYQRLFTTSTHRVACLLGPYQLCGGFEAKRGLRSTSIEAAVRITDPSVEHPATGPPTASADDVCTYWREYWDVSNHRPYYHHMRDHRTSWNMPEGFPTRFTEYYSRLLEDVGENALKMGGYVLPTQIHRWSTMKRLRHFTFYGILTFACLYAGSLALLAAATFYGYDVGGAWRRRGFDIPGMRNEEMKRNALAVAYGVNNLLLPIHFVAAIVLLRRAAPRLRRYFFSWLDV